MIKKTRIIYILLLAALFFGQNICFAQTSKGKNENLQKEFMAKKIAFFSSELELSPEEAEKFWPLYNELWNKRAENRKSLKLKMRQLNTELGKEIKNETLIKKISNEYLEILPKDWEITVEYIEKFKKILPIEKVARIYYTEEKFRNSLIRELRKQQQNK